MASPLPPSTLPLNDVGSGTITVTTPPPHHSSSLLHNINPITLIIVIAVAVAVALSILLNRRCLRRRSPSTAAVSSSSRRISPEIASSSVVDSLPLFAFSSITRRSATSAAGDCALCLSKFEQRDVLRLLPLCCHAFHAECIDTWLRSNLTCPLCRSAILASESDITKALQSSSSADAAASGGGDSFRLEIGSVSRRGSSAVAGESHARRSRSYSVGSFEYFVEEESEVPFSQARRRSVSGEKDVAVPVESPADLAENEASLAGEVAGGRSWLKDYVDRLSASVSSRTVSFRNSGRFFAGSSRRSDAVPVGDYDVEEACRYGDEISEMFRWLSGALFRNPGLLVETANEREIPNAKITSKLW